MSYHLIAAISLLSAIVFSCNNPEQNNNQSALPYSIVKKMHQTELMDWNKGLVEIDHSVIQKFIERRKWNMEVSPSGLYYQIYQKTNDQEAIDGLIAVLDYKTSLLDGTVIYSSEEFGQRIIHLGHNQEESGLNEGVKMMKKGEKARFIMPPHLAFGVPGDGHRVPYYSILVYEIELVEFLIPQEQEPIQDGWN